MGASFTEWLLLIALVASAALGVGSAFLLHAWTRKRWVWFLIPAFVALWLSLGFGLLVCLDEFIGRQ